MTTTAENRSSSSCATPSISSAPSAQVVSRMSAKPRAFATSA
ncbi:hypothetical protein [Streptomyces sp. F63]|nr:hypothetical protein [Streptomyces sp. F63]